MGQQHQGAPTHILAFDGAWNSKYKTIGIGWCLMDSYSQQAPPSKGGENYGMPTTALHAKAKACFHALSWFRDQQITHLTFLSDSTNLICIL